MSVSWYALYCAFAFLGCVALWDVARSSLRWHTRAFALLVVAACLTFVGVVLLKRAGVLG